MRSVLRVGVLRDLDETQLARAADAAVFVSFTAGEQIIARAEIGETFYVIERGSVVCKRQPGGQRDSLLSAGDFFGERSLLKREPRSCDVFASTDVVLAAIHRDDFEAILGPIADVLEHNVGMRLLHCVPLLADLDADARVAVFKKLRLISFRPGATIVARGAATTHLFIIKSGVVEVPDVRAATDALPDAEADALRERVTEWRRARYGSTVDDDVAAASGEHEGVTLVEGQTIGELEVEVNAASPLTFVARTAVEAFVLDGQTFALHIAPLLFAARALAHERATGAVGTRGAGSDLSAKAGGASASASARSTEPSSLPVATDSFGNTEGGPGGEGEDEPSVEDAGPRPLPPPRPRLGLPLHEFELRTTVGTGSFGRVRMVLHRPSACVFALKMLQKTQVVLHKQQVNIVNERELLMRLSHPFIIKLYDTFRASYATTLTLTHTDKHTHTLTAHPPPFR